MDRRGEGWEGDRMECGKGALEAELKQMLLRNNRFRRQSLSQVEALSPFQSALFDSRSLFKPCIPLSPLPAALHPAEQLPAPRLSHFRRLETYTEEITAGI